LSFVSGETSMERAVREGIAEAPEPYWDVEPSLKSPPGMSSEDLLDREDKDGRTFGGQHR
jgi:hypothetical protein